MKKLLFRFKRSRKASDTRISSPVEPAAGKSTPRPSRNDAIQRPLPTEATDVSNVSESLGALSTVSNPVSKIHSPSRLLPPSVGVCRELESTEIIATGSEVGTHEHADPQLPQPGDADPESVASVLDDIMTLAPISELWDEAYEELSKKDKALIAKYEAQISATLGLSEGNLNGKVQRREQMQAAIVKRIIEIKEGKWKLEFKGHELVVKDLVQPVVGIVQWAKTYVDAAIVASPPASLAWVGVCLLLPLVLNPSVQEASRLKGLDEISSIVSQCSMRESLYRRRLESYVADAGLRESNDSHVIYRNFLKDLYVEILNFQATTFVFLSGHTLSRDTKDMVGWNSWDDMLATIKAREAKLKSTEALWHDTMYFNDWEFKKQQHQESVGELNAINDEVSRFAKVMVQAQNNKVRTELLQWMGNGINPSSNYNMLWDKHERDSSSETGISMTGNWLLRENDQFKQWENDPNSLLWMHGQAGMGKSVLSSSVIHHLESSYKEDPYTAIAYYYFDFNDSKKQDKINMIRSIIAQLWSQRPETPQPLKSLSQVRELKYDPPIEELRSTLKAAITDFTRVYLVIDALDECPNIGAESERHGLLELIKHIHNWAAGNLHVLLTSRKEKDIEDSFKTFLKKPENTILDLEIHRRQVNKDIGTFIDQRIKFGAFPKWTFETKAKVKTTLIGKAQGSFQYVAMQLIPLHNARSENAVDQALATLPTGLDGTYCRALQCLSQQDQKQVIRALRWIAFCLRPITVSELSEAVIIDVPDESEQHTLLEGPSRAFDTRNRFDEAEEVLHLLPGLVVVEGTPTAPSDKRIRFSHFSVKEYLMSDRIKEGLASAFAISEHESQIQIAKSCLLYHLYISGVELKTQDGPTLTKTKKSFPLWEYAVWYGLAHIEAMPQEHWTQSLQDLIISVLTPRRDPFLNLLRMDDPKPLRSWHRAADKVTTPLYYTAHCDYLQITLFLLDKKVSGINDLGGYYGTALNEACTLGNESCVRSLLDAGADPFIGNEICCCALAAATLSTYDNREGGGCAKLLLGLPDVLKRCQKSNYLPLINAVQAHRLDICEALIKLKANCNERESGTESPFSLSVMRRDLEKNQGIIDLFLSNGADVNSRHKVYGNLLQGVTAIRSAKMIKELLVRGAKVDPPGRDWEDLLASISHLSHFHKSLRPVPISIAYKREFVVQSLRGLQAIFGERSRAGTWTGASDVDDYIHDFVQLADWRRLVRNARRLVRNARDPDIPDARDPDIPDFKTIQVSQVFKELDCDGFSVV